MPEKTFSMFSQPEARAMQAGFSFPAPEPTPKSLVEKYRPATLAEIVGQSYAVDRLAAFSAAPYPTAFLFAGETGTGKTSAAVALANELGVDPNWSLHRVSSGEMDAEEVRTTLKSLRFSAPNGGWKLVVCDEADGMSPKAKQLWLSALEDLPPHTVIVFTTNHMARFDQRFIDRCELLEFDSSPSTLIADAQILFDRLWSAERLPGMAYDVRGIDDLVIAGAISFRRVVRAIERAKQGALPPRPVTVAAKPTVSVDLAEKRRQAGFKAAQTRKLRLAQQKESRCG